MKSQRCPENTCSCFRSINISLLNYICIFPNCFPPATQVPNTCNIIQNVLLVKKKCLTCQLLERRKSSQYRKNKVIFAYLSFWVLFSHNIYVLAPILFQRHFAFVKSPFQGETLGDFTTERVLVQFQSFDVIVTDRVDHSLLNIWCSMSQPHPTTQQMSSGNIQCPIKHRA